VVWPTVLLTSKKSLDIKVFKNVIDINIYGTIYVAKYASLIMAKNQQINEQGDRGVIIMISSVAADEGLRG
jgi:NAD(P)-dependent dehydrogenase (short-subunit alcohol dehydrogenase family)